MSYTLSRLDIQFLSSLMANPAGLIELNKEVSINDFSDPLYYELYSEIVTFIIASKSPSYSDLKFKYRKDALMIQILGEMEEEQQTVDNLNIVYNELCEVSQNKQLLDLGKFIYGQAENKAKSNDLTKRAEAKLMQITARSGLQLQTVSDLAPNLISGIGNRVQKFKEKGSILGVIDLPTGFESLDTITLGLQRKNTWVLAGGTSDGKTQMAVQIVNSIMRAGKRVLYFLLEDAKDNLLYRLLSLRSGIPITKIMIGDLVDKQYTQINEILGELKQGDKLLIEDETIDINMIIAKAQYAKLRYPDLGVVVVDHINLSLDPLQTGTNREQEISSASKKCVGLAKKCDVAVLVLQQINTAPDQRTNGLPVTMNDLRDSKAVGHDAAITTFLYCPDKYDEHENYSKKHVQLIVAKNRYGEVNKIIDFTNNAAVARFVEGIPRKKQNAKK